MTDAVECRCLLSAATGKIVTHANTDKTPVWFVDELKVTETNATVFVQYKRV